MKHHRLVGRPQERVEGPILPQKCRIHSKEKLLALKQTGGMEYVKKFSTLMLDIRDMSEKDKIFLFINGLQPWGKTKIYEKKIQDLATAIASTERLLDFGSKASFQRKITQNSNTRGKPDKSQGH